MSFGTLSLAKSAFRANRKERMIDGAPSLWACIAKTGKFEKGGRTFVLTDEVFSKTVANFYSETNPVPVYFGHADVAGGVEEPPAAGWIIAMASDDGRLYAEIELTPRMVASIKDGEFRFTSVHLDFNATNESGESIGPRLRSLAATNTPFLDGLGAMQLSRPENEIDSIYLSQEFTIMTNQNENTSEKLAEEKDEGAEETAPKASPEAMEKMLEDVRKLISDKRGEELELADALAALAEMLGEAKPASDEAEKVAASTEALSLTLSAVASERDSIKAELAAANAKLAEIEEAKQAAEIDALIASKAIKADNRERALRLLRLDRDLFNSFVVDNKRAALFSRVTETQTDDRAPDARDTDFGNPNRYFAKRK